jgi:hypothetical protein
MECEELVFSSHAVQRMFERSLSPSDIRNIIESGEVIVEYPDDKPYPSYVMLGFINDRAIHAVVATDLDRRKCCVITVYLPDPELWTNDFRTRRT